jgi:hypothetical protein
MISEIFITSNFQLAYITRLLNLRASSDNIDLDLTSIVFNNISSYSNNVTIRYIIGDLLSLVTYSPQVWHPPDWIAFTASSMVI